MSRWPRGEAQIEQLMADKQLQQVIGGQANGADLLQKASRTLETAGEIADHDPTARTCLPTTPPGIPAPRSLPTRACAQRLQVGTTRSRWLFVPSLATASGPSAQCDDDATNSSTPLANPQLWQHFSRVERVTGIEPALSAWESHMDPRSVLTWRI